MGCSDYPSKHISDSKKSLRKYNGNTSKLAQLVHSIGRITQIKEMLYKQANKEGIGRNDIIGSNKIKSIQDLQIAVKNQEDGGERRESTGNRIWKR
jgi:hypothetical protein